MKRILIVDYDPDILEMLADILTFQGYFVLRADCGKEAVRLAGEAPDLILLDINMPDMDGLAVCRAIRGHVGCPILFLTARIEDRDKIQGFQAGGDDYILKPFSMDELLARINAHLRREERRQGSSRVSFSGGLVIDYGERAVYHREQPMPFAKKEFEIIELLSLHAGQVFDKERIFELVWGFDNEGDSSVVAEHIRRIRAKMAAVEIQDRILTVWGVGYKWKR